MSVGKFKIFEVAKIKVSLDGKTTEIPTDLEKRVSDSYNRHKEKSEKKQTYLKSVKSE